MTFVINKSHSKSELIDIIKCYHIPIENPIEYKKIDLSALLVNQLSLMDSIIPVEKYWFFTIIDLRMFLTAVNPLKILSVKQKKIVIQKTKNIIHFTRNDLKIYENGYTFLEEVHQDALLVARYGDVPSCRRAIRLYNDCPSIIDTVKIKISYHCQRELNKRKLLKKNKLCKYSKSVGSFSVSFD